MKILLITAILFIAAIVALVAIWFIATKGVSLDEDKLKIAQNTVTIYDADGNKIESASLTDGRTSVKAEELHDYTINAFIASEDRDFYRHHGINYKRMIKALYRNVTSMKFKEGASTISQQLIKNTHLSGEKTIQRKLKEIKLTRQLEKKYSKEEIMSMYLNTIYFGHSCYGICSAAKFYFGTDARDLDLNQSATIVGLLASPNNYSPFKNEELCIRRRNLVLNSMLECGFITEDEYRTTAAMPIGAKRTESADNASDYISMVFDELNSICSDPYEIMRNYKIYTYLDSKLQSGINELCFDCDHAIIVRDADGGIAAFSSSVGLPERQPGSTAKPIMVYAPAIEEKKIHLFSKIDDSSVNYGGYAPENYDKKYHGNVTAEESLMYSYNIPAVKTLNSLGVMKAAEYAQKMGIELTTDDRNLALALGGIKSGVTLKQLCDSYSVFQNGGNFRQSSFIKCIKDNEGKTIYSSGQKENKVFSEGTCSLINKALIDTTKNGTGKRLKNYAFDIATKTGTCGNENGNTDAYAIAYTSDKVIGVWLGDRNNTRLNVTGGTDCCEIAAKILDKMYAATTPAPLETVEGTTEVSIDRREYELTGNILLSDENSPKLNNLTVRCLSDNLPTVKSSAFSSPTIQKPSIYVENNSVNIVLCQTKYYEYCIYREGKTGKELIYQGKWSEKICDKPPAGSYRYSVVAYYDNGRDKFFSDEVALPQVMISDKAATPPAAPLPDIVNKNWFDN